MHIEATKILYLYKKKQFSKFLSICLPACLFRPISVTVGPIFTVGSFSKGTETSVRCRVQLVDYILVPTVIKLLHINKQLFKRLKGKLLNENNYVMNY